MSGGTNMISIEHMNNVRLSAEYQAVNIGVTKQNAKVNSQVLELLNKLYLKHPTWVFELGVSRETEINSFRVKQPDSEEILGVVRREFTTSEYKYGIFNERIRNSNARGGKRVTKDVDKAISIIKKYFYPTTFNERFKSTMTNINEAMTNATNRKRNDAYREDTRVLSECNAWVEANFQAFLTFVSEADKGKRLVIGKMMEHANTIMHEHKGMLTVADTNMHERVYVILEDGKYLVKNEDRCATYTDSDLPEDLKLGMGMLKLAPDKFFVTDIGFRFSDKEFLIIRKKNDESISKTE